MTDVTNNHQGWFYLRIKRSLDIPQNVRKALVGVLKTSKYLKPLMTGPKIGSGQALSLHTGNNLLSLTPVFQSCLLQLSD